MLRFVMGATVAALVIGVSAQGGKLIAAGAKIPSVKMNTSEGKAFDLSAELKNAKAKGAIVNFYFNACPPCRSEMPHLVALHDKYSAKGLRVISINVVDDAAAVAQFRKEFKVPFPVLVGRNNSALREFGVTATPTNYVIDGNGKVIDSFVGFDQKRLSDALAKLGFKS